jgi:hypothetical protein
MGGLGYVDRRLSAAAATVTIVLTLKLDGRAWQRAVRAEYAAVAFLWTQQDTASLAFVEELACVHRHLLDLAVAAVGACDLGAKFRFG